jgi:hypothetical protein
MPPGNARARTPAKVIEKATAEACLAIAQRVQRARERSGDEAGSDAAHQVAQAIEEELLRVARRDPEQ